MKRLFLAFLSVFMMTACSSAPAAESSQKEEAPAEEETQEQAETPAEETPEQEETAEETPEEPAAMGAIYGIADTTYVSFEIDELNWTMMPGGDLNNVGYAFSSGTGNIQVLTRDKTEPYERNGLGADAALKEFTDAVKARLESDGKTEYTEYTETEIDGHPGILAATISTEDDGSVYYSRMFYTLIDDTYLVSISLEAMSEEDFNACKDAFDHILKSMYFHDAL